MTGNKELEAEGKTQHAKGKVEEKVDDAKDTTRGAAKAAKDALPDDEDEQGSS